jgi:predicted RNA-binding protein YlqC (UPF0109 family)
MFSGGFFVGYNFNMDDKQKVANAVREIARMMVDSPEEVKVEYQILQMSVTYRLTVASSDIGKVIGQQGRIARALRTVIGTVGMKHNVRVNLEIVA